MYTSLLKFFEIITSNQEKGGVNMEKYVFKINEKIDRKEIKDIKQPRTRETMGSMDLLNGRYLSSLPGIYAVMSQLNAEELESRLKGFGQKIEGKVFERTGDDYWHTEYRTEIINEKDEFETVRIVRHKVAAAMCSFTAFDIFIGGKRIDIFESIWNELISHFHPAD